MADFQQPTVQPANSNPAFENTKLWVILAGWGTALIGFFPIIGVPIAILVGFAIGCIMLIMVKDPICKKLVYPYLICTGILFCIWVLLWWAFYIAYIVSGLGYYAKCAMMVFYGLAVTVATYLQAQKLEAPVPGAQPNAMPPAGAPVVMAGTQV